MDKKVNKDIVKNALFGFKMRIKPVFHKGHAFVIKVVGVAGHYQRKGRRVVGKHRYPKTLWAFTSAILKQKHHQEKGGVARNKILHT